MCVSMWMYWVTPFVLLKCTKEIFLYTAPEFAFSASVYNVSEGDVNFMVQITFISGFINAELDIVLATSNATAGTWYSHSRLFFVSWCFCLRAMYTSS